MRRREYSVLLEDPYGSSHYGNARYVVEVEAWTPNGAVKKATRMVEREYGRHPMPYTLINVWDEQGRFVSV